MATALFFNLTLVVFAQGPGGGAGKGPGGGGGVTPPHPSGVSPLDGCTNGINTALGCISIDNWDSLVETILKFAIGISGGIAFLLMVMAGFMIMTSRGDPKRLSAGQELLTSAIMGLLLLIFSVFILKIIGVDLLGIQGFGT